MHFHRDLSMSDSVEKFADSTVNPPERWVYRLHHPIYHLHRQTKLILLKNRVQSDFVGKGNDVV